MDSNSNSSNNLETLKDRKNSRRIINILSDWLDLLSGPPNSTFTEIVVKENWARLLKVLALVLIFSGVILGISIGISGSLINVTEMLLSSQPAVITLIAGILLAVFYNGFAYLFGIKITLAKSFFVVLSIGLPWLPVLALLQFLKNPQIEFPGIGFVYLFGFLVLIKPMINFYFGISELTRCVKWRILASMLTPLILGAALIIYIFD